MKKNMKIESPIPERDVEAAIAVLVRMARAVTAKTGDGVMTVETQITLNSGQVEDYEIAVTRRILKQ